MDATPAAWTEDIRPAAAALLGEPLTFERRSGVGGPGVTLITGPRGRAVAKWPGRQEARFYISWAPVLRERGLRVPELYAAGGTATQPWLLMEALATPLMPPYRDHWPRMTAYLAQLHTIAPDQVPAALDLADSLPVRPVVLSAQDIEDAKGLWPEGERLGLTERLHWPWPSLPPQRRLVSGDPNPTNWGLGPKGQLVLFDWSEVAWSHPAYDLAVICGGLPSVAWVEEVVGHYLCSLATPSAHSRDQWVAWVIYARLVSSIWFAAWWQRGQLTPAGRRGADLLRDRLIGWMDAVHPAVARFAD